MFFKASRGFLCCWVVLALAGPAIVAADGKAVFTAQKCDMCHAVPRAELTAKIQSEKMKGPDLPAVSRGSEWLAGYLKREIQLHDADHKKEFKGSDDELKAIVAWLVELEGAR